MNNYDPKSIEAKWQAAWEASQLYAAVDGDSSRPKSYVLPMFPYPSGDGLHVGHVLNYTISDIIARFRRMNGYNVLHPIGWDAFGLPAENYAIKTGVSPQEATKANTDTFRKQLKALGISFDWSRELNTSSPDYYRWTQWIFLQLHERGLAYQSESEQWWCPHDKTVLANEQVEQGRCYRCGHVVTKKRLKQWFFKITDYAEELLNELDGLDWPEKIKSMQRNWIGKSEGAEIDFAVGDQKITVYTTRPDTLAGATFLVLAPEHPLVEKITTSGQHTAVGDYIEKAKSASEIERQDTSRQKTGVPTGAVAKNPITGDDMPIWVADYVLGGYGTGAIMAVPAHDERDYEFAKAFDLPVKVVIEPVTGTPQVDPEHRKSIVAIVRNAKGEFISINWGEGNGGNIFIGGGRDGDEDVVECAKREIAEETGFTDLKFVGQTETIHHHYFAHSKNKAREIEAVGLLFDLVSDKQDKPKLEADEEGKFTVEWLSAAEAESRVQDELHRYVYHKLVQGGIYAGTGPLVDSGEFNGLAGSEAQQAIIKWLFDQDQGRGATKYKLRDWLISRQRYWGAPIPMIHCPKCGAVPVPEDQLPVVLPELSDYLPAGEGKSPLAKVADWVNVDCPKCGGPAERETDTMDTFACSSWYFLRFADPHDNKAAFARDNVNYWLPVDFYIGGAEHAVLHLLYARFWTKGLRDAGLLGFGEPFTALRNQGMIIAPDGRKMSKSFGNVINPDAVVAKYGADTVRLYEMFMGPYDQEKIWSDEHLGGVNRFVYRVWTLAQELIAAHNHTPDSITQDTGILETEVDRQTHKTIKRVTDDIEDMGFNTMVSALMEYINFLSSPRIKSSLLTPQYAALAWRALETLILLLAPATPHLAEELWSQTGHEGSVHAAAWPKYDPELLKEDLVTVIVQVNGKLRGNVVLPIDASEDDMVAAARADEHVAGYLKGELVKTITVPRKLVNFVIK